MVFASLVEVDMASTWHRNTLVDKMALEAGISKNRATKALEALLDGVEEALKDGARVTLTGFGTFEAAQHKARTGRNPQTGQPIHIPARRVPKFRAGARLKRALSGQTRQAPSEAPSEDPWYSSTF